MASSCGVPWTLLAAVAKTESDFDPTAVSSAGAEGLFQFEPSTFAAYDTPTPTGGVSPPTPFDPTDATYAAARYLCSLGVVANPTSALVAYNCGNPGPACQAVSAGYAEQVLATAASYTASGNTAGGHLYDFGRCAHCRPGGGRRLRRITDRHALCLGRHQPTDRVRLFGAGRLGLRAGRGGGPPGGQRPVAGRATCGRWTSSSPATWSSSAQEAIRITSESMLADGAMVDAPYTGADVRIDTIPMTAGATWGNQVVLGAADPVLDSGGRLMAASKPVHEADELATIIPFRPRRSTDGAASFCPSSRTTSARGDRRSATHDLMWSRVQLSLFEESTAT